MKKQIIRKIIRSLRLHMVVVFLLLGILPATLFSVLFSSLYVKRSVESDVTDMVANGQILGKQIMSSGYLNQKDSDVVDEQLGALSTTYAGRMMVVNRSLTIIKDTYGVDEGKTIVWSNVIKAFTGSISSSYDKDNEYLVTAVPIMSTGKDTDEVLGVLVMNKSMTYVTANLEYFHSVAIITLLVLYAVVIALAILFSGKFTRPFHKLGKAIDAREKGTDDGEDIAVDDFTESADVSDKLNNLIVRMKVVDESRQEFVSNVSHELKTPLTSMKVLADSLNGQDNVPIELYREFMSDIGEEIDRETKIINDLLSLVKMDRAAASLNVSAVNMNELIELILKRLRPIAEKQQVEVVFESFRPVAAEVDEVKISLAITNLVENGIKYNKEGGWVHVTLNADHQYCYIKVEDSGMGIPQDSLDYIFERFYRVDKSHSREIGGTGLGLAITKNAVTMHNGDIKVHSVLGEGTMFDVRIPLNYISPQSERESHSVKKAHTFMHG